MREVKYQAYTDEGMINVRRMTFAGDVIYVVSDNDEHDGYEFQVNPKNLRQYTGLKDKNGKEIWEGDILKWHNYFGISKPCTNCGHVEHDTDILICKVVYKDGAPHHDGNEHADDGLAQLEGDDIKDVEVIGNIYENPELLERSSDDR